MDAQEAQKVALGALVEMLDQDGLKPELRLEAAKVILNRPRFFVDDQHEEK